ADPRAAPRAEKRLEDALGDLGSYPLPAVRDLEKRARVARHVAISYLDGPIRVVEHCVLDRVLAQVPQDLPQLVGVRAHLEVVGTADREPRARELHGVAELALELLRPRR